MTRYIDVNDLSYLVSQKGLPTCIREMAEYIRADYLRWQDFEKCARLANHSPDGVIELMPVSDASLYAFKYVNGHPKNTQELVPDLADPKDLFARLARQPGVPQKKRA